MIPSINTILASELEMVKQPSKTYKMRIDNDAISGHCDDHEAMVQAVYKILNTERYEHIIYSWNYGIELLNLFGKPKDFVCLELRRRISEALLQDDRITSVTDFEFDTSMKKIVKVKFTVHTIYGDTFESEKAVDI